MKTYYGKEKCRILKQIRAEIAKQNDIEWVVSECKHQGDCRGTCPKCEQEVCRLEEALARRQALGKKVAVVGISAGLALSVTSCANPSGGGEPLPPPSNGNNPATETESRQSTDGETMVATSAGEYIVPDTEEAVDGEVLMGDSVLYPESDEPTAGVPMPPESEEMTETWEPLEGEEVPLPGEVPDETAETDFDESLGGEPLPPEDDLGNIGEWDKVEP